MNCLMMLITGKLQFILKVDDVFQFEHQSFNFCNPPSQNFIFFLIRPILSQNSHIVLIFFFFFISKKTNLGCKNG
jgi:hypothetical protein